MKLLSIFLLLVLACSFSGCVDSTGIIVVQDRCEPSFGLDKGEIYDVDLWVRNEASDSRTAEVTVELTASSTKEIRDKSTQIVNLGPGESKQLEFILDGESGIEYQYSYKVKNF